MSQHRGSDVRWKLLGHPVTWVATAFLVFAGAASGATIHLQDFEGATLVPYSGTGTWQLDPGFGPGAYAGSHYAGVDDPSTVTDYVLTSPVFASTGLTGVELSFFHYYNLENTFDGGIVELSVDGGAFSQIPAGAFSLNGYNSTISLNFSSPILGQEAFSGDSGAYLQSIIGLDPLLVGSSSFQFQFRRATDTSVSDVGWFLDDIMLSADSEVPEPTSFFLVGAGIVGIALWRRRIRPEHQRRK